MTTLDILKKTRAAWPSIRNRDAEGKNALLRAMADSLMACAPAILAENRRDMEEARGTISDVMLDRLYLDERRLAGIGRELGTSGLDEYQETKQININISGTPLGWYNH